MKNRPEGRGKMFANSDIYTAMKPLHCAAQLVGLAPYAYVRSEHTGEECLDISRRRNFSKTVWGLLLLCVVVIGMLCKLADNIVSPPDSLMDLVNDNLQIPFFIVTSATALISALTVNRKKMLQFINTLSAVDRSLPVHSGIYREHSIRFTAALVCTTIFSMTTFCCDVYYYTTYNMLYIITIYLPDYIWSINELQFMSIVEMLRVRLTILNKYVPLVFVQEKLTVPRNFRKRPVPRRRTRVSVSTVEADPLWLQARGHTFDMFKLTETYDMLYETCRLTNSMYGFMLAQQLTAYTVCVIADGYNLLCLLIALYKAEDPWITPQGCPALILWNISNLTRLFAVCVACQRVSSEIRLTANQAEVLKLQPDLSAQASHRLTIFSKQLEQCKIEFSACGIFDIGLSQFFVVVLTATTYITMLVLLQR
jgi:hypothetical protein